MNAPITLMIFLFKQPLPSSILCPLYHPSPPQEKGSDHLDLKCSGCPIVRFSGVGIDFGTTYARVRFQKSSLRMSSIGAIERHG